VAPGHQRLHQLSDACCGRTGPARYRRPARRSAVTSREQNHTHVASTRQGGRIHVVKVENKGEGFRRLRIRVAG
jgi:hypothetical protein